MTKSLDYLFDSKYRAKAMRLFIFNEQSVFDDADIAGRIGSSLGEARKEIDVLLKSGLIIKKIFVKTFETKAGESKKKIIGFGLNKNFSYLNQFEHFLTSIAALTSSEIISMTRKAGKIKLIILSGIFIQAKESRLDIMIVGDRLNKRSLEKTIKKMEEEIGKELVYSIFELDDFKYRMGMCDKLIRDVLEGKHDTILDLIGVESV